MTWICESCTFENINDTFLACGMCGCERSTTIHWDPLKGRDHRHLPIPSPMHDLKVVPPIVTQAISMPSTKIVGGKEDRLKPIFEELVQTERLYVKELDAIVTVFLQPLRLRAQETDSAILTVSEVNSIFGNIGEILKVNRELLSAFDQALKEKEKSSSEIKVEAICSQFLKYAPHLKMYAAYAIQYDNAASVLKKLESERYRFGEFINAASAMNEITNSQPLSSFLIKPIQRICKYPLFFHQMMKVVSDTSTVFTILKQSLDRAEEVASKINQDKLKAEQSVRAFEVAKRLENLTDIILEPNRRYFGEWKCYLSEGDNSLTKKRRSVAKNLIIGEKKPRTCFLFNDVLIVTKEIGNGNKLKYEFKYWMSLNQIQLSPNALQQLPTRVLSNDGVTSPPEDKEKSYRHNFQLPLDIVHVASTDREKTQNLRDRQASQNSVSRRTSFLRKKNNTPTHQQQQQHNVETIITVYTIWFRSAAERGRVYDLLETALEEFESGSRKNLTTTTTTMMPALISKAPLPPPRTSDIALNGRPNLQKQQQPGNHQEQSLLRAKSAENVLTDFDTPLFSKFPVKQDVSDRKLTVNTNSNTLAEPSKNGKPRKPRPRPPPPPPPSSIILPGLKPLPKEKEPVPFPFESELDDNKLISKWFGDN